MIKQQEKNGKKFYKFRNIYIGIDPLTGKEIRKSKSGFKTKRETEIYIANLRTEYDNKNYINTNYISFYELYELWFQSYKDTVNPSSLYVTQNVLQHILEYFGNVKVKKITTLFWTTPTPSTMFLMLTSLGSLEAVNLTFLPT